MASWIVAVRPAVPAWELRLTEWMNDAPNVVADLSYPVMQLGTLAGPLVVALAILLLRGDRRMALATVLVGLVTWYGAKVVKRIVRRDRPGAFLPDLLIREGDGTGFGYLSGHSAVATSAAIMAMVALPRSWRPVPLVLAALVGIARIVFGAHLPADVIGGWSFGALMGLGALTALDALEARDAV